MKTIGIGIIGWGFMGKTHAQALRSLPLFYPGALFNTALRCVCARHIENARAAAQAAGFERCTDDYRALLAQPDIDVVSICTPNALHEEMAVAALRSGKHVYIDKPLAVTAESALRIADAAESAPGFTRMVFNNRYFPATLRAKQLMDEGRVGRVLTFSARYLHSGSIDPDKPVGWKQGPEGGALLDMGSHALDLLTWLTGYPSRVFCKTFTLYPQRPAPGGGRTDALSEDHVQLMLELPGGAVGSVEASKIATGSNDELLLEIRGDRGALRWNAMNPNYLEFFDNALPEAAYGGMRGFTQIEAVGRYPAPGGKFLPPKSSVGWERGHLHCYYTFLDAVARGERPTENTVRDGARLQCLMADCLRAEQLGRWVEVKN